MEPAGYKRPEKVRRTYFESELEFELRIAVSRLLFLKMLLKPFSRQKLL